MTEGRREVVGEVKRSVMEMASQPKSEHVMKIVENAVIIIEISGVFIV